MRPVQANSLEEKHLLEQVKAAYNEELPLQIVGAGSKRFYGRQLAVEELCTASLSGIVHYDPSELVVTVLAGTPIVELEAELAKHKQYLPFEPPVLGGKGTVGGMVATAMAGPRRPWSGAVRDFVLGVKIINGRGELLRFGGQVMKNVAGYDVSRLMVGAMGCLGVLTEVSIKVLPQPEVTACYKLATTLPGLLACSQRWRRGMTPVTGIAFYEGGAYIRLEGSGATVDDFAKAHNLDIDANGEQFWQGLRHHNGAFFKRPEALWRLSVPRETLLDESAMSMPIPMVMDWSGAQYWLKSDDAMAVQRLAHLHRGHVYAYHANAVHSKASDALPALPSGIQILHQRLKNAYDPKAILNRGRMYAEF